MVTIKEFVTEALTATGESCGRCYVCPHIQQHLAGFLPRRSGRKTSSHPRPRYRRIFTVCQLMPRIFAHSRAGLVRPSIATAVAAEQISLRMVESCIGRAPFRLDVTGICDWLTANTRSGTGEAREFAELKNQPSGRARSWQYGSG